MFSSFQIRNVLLHECNVVYECRVCLSLFRSVANLVAHKRDYCHHQLRDVRHVFRRDPGEYREPASAARSEVEEGGSENGNGNGEEYVDSDEEVDGKPTTAFVQPEPIETIVPESQWNLGQ